MTFEEFNAIYPGSSYVPIQPNSKVADPSCKWGTNPYDYNQAKEYVDKGGRIGWIVPVGYVVVDIDNKDNPESSLYIKKILDAKQCQYDYNESQHGTHFIFLNSKADMMNCAGKKCSLNISIDLRANGKGYIVLPVNDENRKWVRIEGQLEELPYFLKPIGTPKQDSFIGFCEGGRNDALYIWANILRDSKVLTSDEIRNSVYTINQHLLEEPLKISELDDTALRDAVLKKKNVNSTGGPTASGASKENIHNKIAKQFLEKYDVISYGDTIYDFRDNIYVPVDALNVERRIHFEISEDLSSGSRNEIMKFIILKTQILKSEFNKNPFHIACKNGVLDIETGLLIPLDKKEYNTIGIPWNWNVDPAYSPMIDNFMLQISSSKDGKTHNPLKMQYLYEIGGYCLLKENLFQKFFMFQGEGGTGKSTYQEIIRKMVGDDNCSEISMNHMDNDYYLVQCHGKLVNLDDEAADRKVLEDTSRFKSLTAGNPFDARQIYSRPITIRSFATCIFNCNKLPKIMDQSGGLFRRMMLVELNHKVENPDRMFMKNLSTVDMEYFLFKCVKAIQNVLKTGNFSILQSDEELLRKFKCRQSILNEWIYENDICMKDVHMKSCAALYAQFIEWAKEHGYNKYPFLYSVKEDLSSLFGVDIVRNDRTNDKYDIFKRTPEPKPDELYWKPF